MPKPIDVAEAKVFRTKHGGCRPERPDKLHKDHPLYDPTPPTVVVPDHVQGGFVAVGTAPADADYRAEYLGHFVPENQGGTGICTAEAALVAHQWVRYKVLKASAIRLSAGFIYYTNTHDATFRQGSGVSSAIATGISYGACLGSFYSQDYLLQQFNLSPGATFRPDQLPQPPAYADGLTRKTLQWTRIAYSKPDMNLIKLRLAAGYPVAFGIGNHAMCLIGYASNGYPYFAMDSESADTDNGYGKGIRGFFEDALYQNGYDFTTIDMVDVSGQAAPMLPLVIPSATDFGAVHVGDRGINNRTIDNFNAASVSARIDITGAQASQFAALPYGDFSVPAQGSTSVTLYFTPTGGAAAATATVSSSAGTPQSFQLTGNGGAVQPPLPPPPPPTGNTQMLIDTIKADANALVLGQITQAQIDKIKADVAQLVPDATTTTPPPSTSTVILAPNAIPKDAAGNTWTWGALVRADLGYSLALNGRALKTATKVAIVSGVLRCYDPGGGGWFAYTGGPQGPFTWASSSAP